MPKVPYSGLPQVEGNALSQRRQSDAGANATAFGAGEAQGLAQIGQGVQDVGRGLGIIKRLDDERAARDADTAYQTFIRERLVGTPDSPGYLSLKGQEAVDALPQVQKDLADTRKKMSENLGSAQARRFFDDKSNADLNNHLERTGAHSLRERDTALQATLTAQLTEAQNHAAAFATDINEVGTAMQLAEDAVIRMLDAGGITDKATRQSKIAEAQSATLKTAITSLTTEYPDKALEMYEATKHLITGTDRAELDKRLKDVTMSVFAQETADMIWQKFTFVNPDGSINFQEREAARQYIRDHFSGQKEDEAIKGLEVRWRQQDADASGQYYAEQRILTSLARREAQEARELKAEQQAVKGRAFAAINGGMSFDEYKIKNPNDAKLLNEMDETMFRRAEVTYWKGETFSRTSNNETLEMVKAMSVEERAAYAPEGDMAVMTEGEYNLVKTLVTSAKGQMQNRDSVYFPMAERAMKHYAPQSYGFGQQNPTDPQKASQSFIREPLYAWITDQINQGNKLTQADIEEQARVLAVPVSREKWSYSLWGGTTPAVAAGKAAATWTETDKKNAVIPMAKINSKQLDQIKQGLDAAGVQKPSNQLIERIAGQLALGRTAEASRLVAEAAGKPGYVPPVAVDKPAQVGRGVGTIGAVVPEPEVE